VKATGTGATPEQLSFDVSGVLKGGRVALPVALTDSAVALVFGVLARQAGLSPAETVLMSVLVFAGAAQFVALGLWASPLPVASIVLTTLVVNLRHVLMGASLRPWFSRLSPLNAYTSLFFMVDESWALSIAQFNRGEEDGSFLLGAGLAVFIGWVGGTFIGRTLGTALKHPSRFGLDFAITAVFLALLVGLWKGKSDVLPWAAAAAASVVGFHVLPGKWYILLGALVGTLAGGLVHAD
jgi:4-azaleucine resistance transporter AzlC